MKQTFEKALPREMVEANTEYIEYEEPKEMTVGDFSRQQNPDWNGICCVCGHDYRNGCQGNCTCLSCNGQRQSDEREAEKLGIVLTEQ